MWGFGGIPCSSKVPDSLGGAEFPDMSGIENDLGEVWQLDKLKMKGMLECEALEEFPVGVSNLEALEEPDFGTCRELKMIPESFGNFTKLKIVLMLECGGLEEFPVGVRNLI